MWILPRSNSCPSTQLCRTKQKSRDIWPKEWAYGLVSLRKSALPESNLRWVHHEMFQSLSWPLSSGPKECPWTRTTQSLDEVELSDRSQRASYSGIQIRLCLQPNGGLEIVLAWARWRPRYVSCLLHYRCLSFAPFLPPSDDCSAMSCWRSVHNHQALLVLHSFH